MKAKCSGEHTSSRTHKYGEKQFGDSYEEKGYTLIPWTRFCLNCGVEQKGKRSVDLLASLFFVAGSRLR